MDVSRKGQHISNAYYNEGLSYARSHNLTLAAEKLKYALHFSKSNIEARNLLGLIYYEMGEFSDALIQWVLSYNLKKVDNDALVYVQMSKEDTDYFQTASQSIQRFNQSLALAKSGSTQIAIKQLEKILESYPNYLKAELLLGLLYYQDNEIRKAKTHFEHVLSVDTGNPLAQFYLNDLKGYTSSKSGRKEIEKISAEKAKEKKIAEDSAIVLANDNGTVIRPKSSSASGAVQTAVNILLGLVIGFVATAFIYTPLRESNIMKQNDEQILVLNEKLNASYKDYQMLQHDYENLQNSYNEIHLDSDSLDDQFSDKLSNYQKLCGALDALKDGDIVKTCQIYALIDGTQITDVADDSNVSAATLYSNLSELINTDLYAQVTSLGDREYEAGNFEAAIQYYDVSLSAKADNPVAIYKKGLAYNQLGDKQAAVKCFTEVIQKFPDSSVAEMAQNDRGY